MNDMLGNQRIIPDLFKPYSTCFDISDSNNEQFEYPKDMINHIADKCLDDGAPYSCGGFSSYEKIVQLSRPVEPIAFFAQGTSYSTSL